MSDATSTPPQDIDVGAGATTPLLIEPSDRWVRVVVNGVTVADSRRVRLVRRPGVYYFPATDVRMDLLADSGRTGRSPNRGVATYLTLTAGDRTVPNAAWTYHAPSDRARGLEGLVAFHWHLMDHWYEEDDEVYVHPRDPYHRVDVLNSSRQVTVVVNGVVVAETDRPRLLFETGLPIRFYIPQRDVRMDLLVPSPTETQCPYKGVATYWSVRVGDGMLARDLAWTYRYPIPECPKIENLIAFFDEQVDAISVDGEELPRPKTPWSKPVELTSER
jgi:uncharacterized protein (DUF427 family)